MNNSRTSCVCVCVCVKTAYYQRCNTWSRISDDVCVYVCVCDNEHGLTARNKSLTKSRFRITVSSQTFSSFSFQVSFFSLPLHRFSLPRTALFPSSPASLRFFLPPPIPCSCLSYFALSLLSPAQPDCAFSPFALSSHPPTPTAPFSGPVGKARETFIFARRKSKAEREVLPADRYCEADVFCDSSVIRERVRERREKPKAPRRSLARSLAHSRFA